MGYWVAERKTGALFYQVTPRVRLRWGFFDKEHLRELMEKKEITNLDYLEALLDIDL